MDDSAIGQKLKVLLLCGVGLVLAIFLGLQIGHENYGDLLLGAVIIFVASIALFSGRSFWVLTIASSFLGGTFPILRAQFTPFQILMAIGVVKFLIGDVVLRRTQLKLGNRFDTLMIAGFMGVLTWHGVHDRFGMRFLGSSVWGGHNYVNVYVGLAAFFVVQSIPMQTKIWAKLPYAIMAVATFDLFIAVITTIFPGSIYKIYPFYSAVSTASLEEAISGTTEVTGRIGALGNFGFNLIALVFASISLRQILSPAYFSRLIALLVGFVTVLYSGFRSAVLNTLILFVSAGIRDLKWGVLILMPVFAIFLFAISALNTTFHLPKQIQRGLAFVPGEWDVEMAADAAASNDYRRKIWDLWIKAYFPARPWLGRGFGFRSDWSKISIQHARSADYKQMVETGNMHNGLFATVDAVGIVGTIFFVAWNLRILAQTFRFSVSRREPAALALRFLALLLSVSIISYWAGALSVGSFLPQEFALAGLFFRLQRAMRLEAVEDQPVDEKLQQGSRAELAPAQAGAP